MNDNKMIEYISKNGTTESMKGEWNDCAVRAVSAAFNVSYDYAHDFAKQQWSRKRRRGCNTYLIINTMRKAEDPKIGLLGKNTKSVSALNEYTFKRGNIRGVTKCKSKLGTFAKKNSKGTYFVLVRGHATVIKDGVILDNYAPGSIVRHAWKIEDIK